MRSACLSAFLALVAIVFTHGQEIVKITSAEDMVFLFMAIDNNMDGVLTYDDGIKYIEHLVLQKQLFRAGGILQNMDTDKDGLISLEEFEADLGYFNMDIEVLKSFIYFFPTCDENGDGKLSLSEALPLFSYMFPFQKLDLDKDGILTKSEFLKAAKPLGDNATPEMKKEFDEEANKIFKDLDKDENKQLDPKEYFYYESGLLAGLKAWEELINMSDKDKDGKVTPDDFVEVRLHPNFPNTAAYHHSKEWIRQIKEILEKSDEFESANSEAEL